MNSPNTDNVTLVLKQLVSHLKLPLTIEDIELQVKTHPEYPSLKSICDTLESWQIQCNAVRLEFEQLEEIKAPFIAHLLHQGQQHVAFVKKYQQSLFTYYTTSAKVQQENETLFREKYSGIAILMDYSEAKAPESNTKKNKLINWSLMALSLFLFLFVLTFSLSEGNVLTFPEVSNFYWLTSKLLGLTLTVILLSKYLKGDSGSPDRFCQIGKAIDCNTVLTSRYAKVYGWIGWTDLAFIYFLSGFLLTLYGDRHQPVLNSLSLFTILLVPLSLYAQSALIKKWCTVCTALLPIIIFEFLLSLNSGLAFTPDKQIWLEAGFVYGILTLVVLSLRRTFDLSKSSHAMRIKYQQLSREPQVFKSLLKGGQRIELQPESDSLLFVQKGESPLSLTAFLSLNCKHCADVFNALTELIMQQENISIRLILVYTKDERGEKNFIEQTHATYHKQGPQAALGLLKAWHLKTFDFNNLTKNKVYSAKESPAAKNAFIVMKNRIRSFPTIFVQGHHLPEHYEIKDIPQFEVVLRSMDQDRLKREMII